MRDFNCIYNINPLFVILLSYFILGEVLNGKQFIGVLLILIGGYIIKNLQIILIAFTMYYK